MQGFSRGGAPSGAGSSGSNDTDGSLRSSAGAYRKKFLTQGGVMGSDYHEKDFEDEVYEDDYYEEHYEEEELADDSERAGGEELIEEEEAEAELEAEEEEDLGEPGWDEDDEKKVTVSYACEECDYRWDDIIIKKKGVIEEEEIDIICPMCGSMNVTLI
jgi:hypothetical protein